MERSTAPASVDAYLAAQPDDIRAVLEELRAIIKKAAPMAEEVISYQMPAYKYHGMLVYFAAWKNHYAFYPGNAGTIATLFGKELEGYEISKGTIRFTYAQPVPAKLITAIVKERMKQNEAKATAKKSVKKTTKK